ncbi:uncharacterized protein LOC62_02G003296 [Vanrija pseudolonga]|uniref:Uncharacterized protein n=1 Tax=Vanrija pseudolonga TaxID=143232 RepID=A0AAF0Y462_9TREE|nr:hypothetical protein LOC62_02G003296 [Vanrija pseudolonga]
MLFRNDAEHAEALKRANSDPLKPGHHVEMFLRLGSDDTEEDRADSRAQRADELKSAGIAGEYKIYRLNLWYGELAFFQVKGGLSWAMREASDASGAAKNEGQTPAPHVPVPASEAVEAPPPS